MNLKKTVKMRYIQDSVLRATPATIFAVLEGKPAKDYDLLKADEKLEYEQLVPPCNKEIEESIKDISAGMEMIIESLVSLRGNGYPFTDGQLESYVKVLNTIKEMDGIETTDNAKKAEELLKSDETEFAKTLKEKGLGSAVGEWMNKSNVGKVASGLAGMASSGVTGTAKALKTLM